MTNKSLLLSAGSAVIGLIIGGIIGHYITPKGDKFSNEEKTILSQYSQIMEDNSSTYQQYILDNINRDNLKENLRLLTVKPHLAGSNQDAKLAQLFADRLNDAGFDWVKRVPYTVLLSQPDVNNPNEISLLLNDVVNFTSTDKEIPIHEDDYDPNFVPAFNAYTPAGDVTRDKLVYANYGRVEDFVKLKELGIVVEDAVVIVRYGKIFRGNKIDNAYKNGAVALIIFSDPEDIAADGIDEKDVYPNTWWLPGTGMQRGTTYLGDGDPLTPGWPSISSAYRIPQSEADLPKIPSQPIGYTDALEILKQMRGATPPDDSWKGGLVDLNYHLGPTMAAGYKIRVNTHNKYVNVSSDNVIGVLKGSVEPDRYVLIGNHRDAWGYGAADPSSGTSQLLEVTRVLGSLVKMGWKPKRSIVVCSWGAEEYGLIGSTEWVEEHLNRLQGRAVAYINTDTCASGPILQANASPLLWDLIQRIAEMVPGVKDPSSTILEEWKQSEMISKPDATSRPVMRTLGSGSDYAPFIFYGGIPAVDIWFRRDTAKHNISIYPSYHTGYETFHMMSEIMDPEFKIHQGCGRVSTLMLKYIVDSKILPLNITRFPEAMKQGLETFQTSGLRDKIVKIYPNYVFLEETVDNLYDETIKYTLMLTRSLPSLTPSEIRAINDQLMTFEQNFIIPEGLPGRPSVRHAIFAPSLFDNYAAAGFPGIGDLLHEYDDRTPEDKLIVDSKLKLHISNLVVITHRAIGMLKDYENFD